VNKGLMSAAKPTAWAMRIPRGVVQIAGSQPTVRRVLPRHN